MLSRCETAHSVWQGWHHYTWASRLLCSALSSLPEQTCYMHTRSRRVHRSANPTACKKERNGYGTHVQVLQQIDFGLRDASKFSGNPSTHRLRTMICPISLLGMLLRVISLMATVSPVAQLRAPNGRGEGLHTSPRPRKTYGRPGRTRPSPANLPIAAK